MTIFKYPERMTDRYCLSKQTLTVRSVVCAVLLSVAGLTACSPSAPDIPSDRLNRIIEQFERGEAAFANEHWQLTSLEHNPFRVDDLANSLNDVSTEDGSRPRMTPIARIPQEADQDFHHIVKQLLDAGVFGIVLPQVRTAPQVTKLVQAMRYPPQQGSQYPDPVGRRGWGPTGARQLWGLTNQTYAEKADVWPLNPEGELLAIVMIETREAIEDIDEILSVPGLGGALIGPADLSLSLGVGTPAANGQAPEVEDATAKVGQACVTHNVICGSFGSPDVELRLQQGFRLFTRSSP